jgi:proteasome lid subunit RPN8/RPN11
MREEAERCFPREACGFVIRADHKKARFMPANNVAESNDQFLIQSDDWMRAEDAGEILAIWHSHPNTSNQPSEYDQAGCNMTELPWLISSIHVEEGRFVHDPSPRLVMPNGARAEYVGRPYVFGTFDCYSLVTDFYEREFRIKLRRFPELRISHWWNKGLDIVSENWESQGFIRVTDGTFQNGDILGIGMDSEVPNHLAVYVMGDIILHHLVNRLSRRETFGPYWLSRTKLHLRHKSKC